ncbi:MAG: hypothetical protein MAG453_00536 [Calditrichaeota bacterium]|nr:hypothetical protein [Calditrichota bacterium]
MKTRLLIIALLGVAAGCAQVGAPGGGPEDKIPPEVVDTVPAPGTTNADTAATITVRFSEDINRGTLKSAFGLSPPPPGKVRANWHGDEVEIRFVTPLKPELTYVLTIGTQLSDTRGNKLQESFVLPFSTGDELDRGEVKGSLITEDSPIGWEIAGYHLGEDAGGAGADPDPSVQPPEATTQTGADGSWRLSNLRAGWWRVFAFKDEDGDRLWTPWLEQIAVPAYNVQAFADTSVSSRALLLKPADPLVLPSPRRVQARLATRFSIRFDRAPVELDADYELTDLPDDTGQYPDEWVTFADDFTIPVYSKGYRPGDSTTVLAGAETRLKSDAIGLRVRGSFGTPDTLDTVLVVDLTAAALRDTFPPALVEMRPPERSNLHRGRNRVQFIFSKPVRAPAKNTLRMYPTRKDTLYPEVTQPIANSYSVDVPLDTPGGAVTFELLGRKGVRDLAGNALPDSSLVRRYGWLGADSLGSVSGSVRATHERAPVHLAFHSVQDVHLPLRLSLPGSAEFRLDNVPAGRWSIHGWQDVSRTGGWSRGLPVPFAASDPVVVVRDTIEVRARWESGGVEVIFP